MTGAKRCNNGFSLLEVLVAFSILALALGVLLRIFSGDGRLAGLAGEHSQAVVLAQSLLAKAGTEIPLQQSDTHGELGRYVWSMRVSPFIAEDVPPPGQLSFMPYWVEVVVEWAEGEERRSFQLSTLRLVGENAAAGTAAHGLMPR